MLRFIAVAVIGSIAIINGTLITAGIVAAIRQIRADRAEARRRDRDLNFSEWPNEAIYADLISAAKRNHPAFTGPRPIK